MKTKRKQSGITLMEMTVVIAAVALLAVFGLPAIRAFVNSLESKGPAEAMIDAALSSARSIALREQRYAGIRFQKAYNPKGPLEAAQYMIFIIYDTEIPHGAQGNLGCRAVEGIEPIKLPDSVGVMDLIINKNTIVDSDGEISTLEDVNDTTTFSILFSPSGKLIIHNLWVRNRDGVSNDNSMDDIFNSLTNVRDNKIGMFLQDESSGDLKIEPSRNSFIIYDTEKFKKTNSALRWTGYLRNLTLVYVNPYTGTIIGRD